MTNSKLTKRSLLASGISLLLCFAMLLGTTFAWFTDSVTSAGNIIKSGNLKIDLIHNTESGDISIKDNTAHKIFDYDKWEPGYTQVETLTVVNEGNLALKYEMTANAENAVLGANNENLAEVIDVYMCFGKSTATSAADLADTSKWWKIGTLAQWMSAECLTSGKLLPEGATYDGALYGEDGVMIGSQTVSIALHMQEEAGNEYQGLSVGDIGLVLNATQWTYEEDSFNNQYDKESEYPILVSNNDDLNEAIKAGKTKISLSSGTYQIPKSAKGKTLTLTGSGSDNTIIEVVPAGQGEAGGQLDYSLDGSTVTFNNLTIKTNSQLYAGYARLSAVYNNCTIQNTYNLGVGTSEFNNCEFNITNEYLRVGGAHSATFNGCTFNTDGRAILVYQDGTSVAQTVTVKDCTFNATAPAKTWNGIHVAAVSIDGTNGTYTVNLEGTNTVDSDFNGLWQIKTGEANVTVNK